MPFNLVYYSQQDPQWKNDILGFGDASDTIGYIGCALTSVAMMLSGHGYMETPKTLNQKLKNIKGFAGASIYWGAVSQLYPQVTIKSNIDCSTGAAPLNLIDTALAAGQPAVVQVDYSNAPGIQTHWVMVYGKTDNDYLMLDPWPYQPGTAKPDLLMKRYSQGNPLQRAISHVILYQAFGASGGPISMPAGSSGQPTTVPSSSQPTPAPTPTNQDCALVQASVTWGLNIRSSIDTSSLANVVATVPAGTQLTLLEPDGLSKVGAINQWVRVRTPDGKEGFAAAWYLEKLPAATPASTTGPATGPASETSPSTPSASTGPQTPDAASPSTSSAGIPATNQNGKLIVVVSSAVGTSGLRLRSTPSLGGTLITILGAGTQLTVLEPAQKAKAKIGQINQWLYVRGPNNQRGYVGAQYVTLP